MEIVSCARTWQMTQYELSNTQLKHVQLYQITKNKEPAPFTLFQTEKKSSTKLIGISEKSINTNNTAVPNWTIYWLK